MEIICRDCQGNAFRLLPEETGTVTAECLACGALTSIEIPRPDPRPASAVPVGQQRLLA